MLKWLKSGLTWLSSAMKKSGLYFHGAGKQLQPAGPVKSKEERVEMLKIAIESGATFVDIEYEASPTIKRT
jgi:anti-sigma28 factor (negative regulator of flagellin synthesis)